MAYGVFDRADENEMISGTFTNERTADDFRLMYTDDDGFENLYVDKVCVKHNTDQPISECDCWNEGPHEDERGSFGPGSEAYSARV